MELSEKEKRYKQALISLRPRGKIWEPKENSVSDVLATVESKAYTKADDKIAGLIEEADIRTTFDCLEDWEELYGLEPEGSYEDRLAALNAKAAKGRQDKPFYIDICKMQGCTVEIEEYAPFMVGLSECGGEDELGEEDIVYYWTIIIKEADSDEAVENMERIVNKLNQSHTIFHFNDKREKA